MRFSRYLFLLITCILATTSCQKELNFDIDGTAKGTLKADVTGDCLPSVVNGIFKADSVLNNSNFIDIQIDLTATGTYDIKSDTINGYSFRGTGSIGITGLNSVRLYASGKPLTEGTDAFTIHFDNSICVVNVIVIGINTGAATYTLEGAPNTCAGATSSGTYIAGTALGINNTVTVVVKVLSPGTYVLGAASVNGMLFTSTGFFQNTGLQSVTLNGAGIPQSAGAFNLVVTNGTSTCTFSITVFPAGGGTATYSLDAAAGACSGAVVSGTYTEASALTAVNTVLVNVTVSSIGTYTINTNNDNGISFSATGSFTATGSQPVQLIGTGTPLLAGNYNYTATTATGTSTCIFSIIVAAPNGEYVPETSNSNWSDKLVGGTAADTSYVQVNQNNIIKNGVTYRLFETRQLGVPTDSAYHRKNVGKYYQLYDQSYGFDNAFNTEGLLLDSGLAVNSTWDIALGSNSIQGITATGLIVAKVVEKGTSATIAGNSYSNVIKVTYTYNYSYTSTYTAYAVEEIWYAKGKGVIYYKANDIPVTFTDVYETTRIQIF